MEIDYNMILALVDFLWWYFILIISIVFFVRFLKWLFL